MSALVRMRLAGFVRSGRALAPVIAAVVVLAVVHGGGQSAAAPAYGYSAVMLFPVLAWQAKLLLDAEPDVQRRLARLSVGPSREASAGLLAAAALGAVFCAVAMVVPWWPFHAIRGPLPGSGEPSTAAGIALGVLAHLLALPAAVALGALASRAVTRTVRNGIAVLVSGAVLAVVLGLSDSIAPWLVPPVMATARALAADAAPPGGTLLLLAGWTLAWCAVALAGYARLRRSRS
ncbi:hypothetical protein ACFQFC_20330 [Amorphoplanes digitatis]|uniref:Uncharacterized protein n=1 Tax=Actinoplanes digitatis TaxID=1868 RepID=A0A7W7MTP0_9ACTN|nr:hypothetical protein [Actinoplanes digitatis]MBB4766568.1 hypothetical protein [Actinoplanes digitatis]GID96965.1 hypothetical protein Adi01nite_63770 [Actinoplanes digitatis]